MEVEGSGDGRAEEAEIGAEEGNLWMVTMPHNVFQNLNAQASPLQLRPNVSTKATFGPFGSIIGRTLNEILASI